VDHRRLRGKLRCLPVIGAVLAELREIPPEGARLGVAPFVAGSPGPHRIVHPESVHCPGIMGRIIHVLHFHSDLFRFPADFFRSAPDTFPEPSAHTGQRPYLFHHGEQDVRVAPFQGQTAGVPGGDPAVLPALHEKADPGAAGDGVYPQAVGHVIGLRHGTQVLHQEVAPHHGDSLVFGTVPLQHRSVRIFEPDMAVAPNGAVNAGKGLHFQVLRVAGSSEEGSSPLVLVPPPVLDGSVADPFEGNDDPGRSVGPELLPLPGEQRERLSGKLRRLLRVMDGNVPRSPGGNGLQVLRAHDGARPSAPGKAVPVAGNAGNGVHHLPCGADVQGVDSPVAQVFLYKFSRFDGILPPQERRVPDLGAAVLYEHVDRAVRPPLEDHGVEAALLEIGGPVARTSRLEEGSREGPLGDDAPFAVAGELHSLEGPHGKDELVLRGERVHLRRSLLEENLRAEG